MSQAQDGRERQQLPTVTVHGWDLYAHPTFLDQFEKLLEEVEARKSKDPEGYQSANCAKRLNALVRLVTRDIPSNPVDSKFRQGSALGKERKHWFRARFFQQYRLFFRFDTQSKAIVLGWVNGEDTLRAYGSKTDAYAVFRRMLDKGNPPDDFASLLQEAASAAGRFDAALRRPSKG